jgi:hypothetical protein
MKVPEKYYDEIFPFAGQWDMPSTCGLKTIRKNDQVYVIVTELYQENPGTSVTYAGGSLIKQICDQKNLDILHIHYIECNPNTNSKLSFYDEEMFEVSYEMDDTMPVNLTYRQLSKDEIRDIVE